MKKPLTRRACCFLCASAFLLLLLLDTRLSAINEQKDKTGEINRQEVILQQESRAQEYINSQEFERSYVEKYPGRERKVLELFARGEWLCDNNGNYESFVGAPTKQLKKVVLDRGLDHMREAIQLDPTFPELYLALGRYLYVKAIQLRNDYVIAKLQSSLIESKKIQREAYRAFERAAKLDPASADAYFGLARNTTDEEEKILDLKRVLEINRSFGGAHEALAHIYQNRKQYGMAAAELQQAIETDREPIIAVRQFERLVAESKQYSQLIDMFRKLIERDPSPSNFYSVLFAISGPAGQSSSPVILSEYMDHKELATVLTALGSSAIKDDRTELVEPAIAIFEKAMEFDSTKVSEIQKLINDSKDERVRKFAEKLQK